MVKSFKGEDFTPVAENRDPRVIKGSERGTDYIETDERRNYYRSKFRTHQIEITHIDPASIPPGVVVLWARFISAKGTPDSSNIQRLEADGWRLARPSMFPALSFTTKEKSEDMEDSSIINHEFKLMYRDSRVHQDHLDIINEEITRKRKDTEQIDPSSPYFSGHAMKPAPGLFGGVNRHQNGPILQSEDNFEIAQLSHEFYNNTLGK